jgi:glutamate-1-semialdehyde 2,1-aminomutase
MEPVRGIQPEPGFLEQVRKIADENDMVLIFDEISVGFRLTCGGAHLTYGVDPDIAVFAKGISNGYPMAAIIGRAAVMSAAQETFISSTYWTERIGPVAALATIKKFRRELVDQHLAEIGNLIQQGWIAAAAESELPVHVGGIAPVPHLDFDGENALAVRTLFTQMMLERGYLATGLFYATFAHQREHVTDYLSAVKEVFALLANAVSLNSVEQQLNGPVAHAGFERLT